MKSMQSITVQDLEDIIKKIKKEEEYYQGKFIATLFSCDNGRGENLQQVLIFNDKIKV